MNISGFTAIRKRLSAPNRQAQQGLSSIAEVTNSSLDEIPSDYRGALKSVMKIEFEFNSQLPPDQTDLQQQQRNMPQSQLDRQQTYMPTKVKDLPSTPAANKNKGLFHANMFSCMDLPDYQRDFEFSPRFISKE